MCIFVSVLQYGCRLFLLCLYLTVFGTEELDQTTQLNSLSIKSACLWKGMKQWNQNISFWDTFKNSVFKAEDRISNLNVAENWKICFHMKYGPQKGIIPCNSRGWGLSSWKVALQTRTWWSLVDNRLKRRQLHALEGQQHPGLCEEEQCQNVLWGRWPRLAAWVRSHLYCWVQFWAPQ